MSTFYGYPGRVWAVVYGAMNILKVALQNTSEPATTLPLAETVMQTALNGAAAINIFRIIAQWDADITTMQMIEGLPLVVTPDEADYFNNRLDCLITSLPELSALLPEISLSGVGSSLAQGVPAISYPGVLEYYHGFENELAPAGLSLTNLPDYITGFADAFDHIATLIADLEGPGNIDYLYDLCIRYRQEGRAFAELNSNYLGFAGVTATGLWNQLFSLPSMLMDADILSSAPNTLAAQQDMLLRYLILTVAQRVEVFMMTVQRPVAQNVSQAIVMIGDSLMDIAARTLRNFERWTEIAAINNLQPPFTGPVKAPGIAQWGSKVLLPTPNAPPLAQFQTNYLFNFLGVDLYFGPINGDMPTWTGDFQLIAGYDNLRLALGRRLQTTLGSLIYHSDYGSLIPPEIGNQEVAAEANYLSAFAKSCLLSDPRVADVPFIQTVFGPNFVAKITAQVQPQGFATTPVVLNEVINSSTSPIV